MVSNDQRPVLIRGKELICGGEGVRSRPARNRALRPVRVRCIQRVADRVESNSQLVQQSWIYLRAYGGLRCSAHKDLAHTIDLRQFLRQD